MDNLDLGPGSTSDDPARLRPVIDQAMQDLDEEDREAVLLRYFEGRDFKSVGTTLGISDDAARKRVARAVERLRAILAGNGISSPESALLAALGGAVALSAPADLHASIIRSALAVSAESAPQIASTLFQMTPMKAALVVTGLAVGLVTPTLLQRSTNLRLRAENESLAAKLAEARATETELRAGQSAIEEQLAQQLARLRKEQSELFKLRDEVTRLRSARRDEARPAAADREIEEQAPVNHQVTIEAKFVKLPAPVLKKLALEAIGIDISGAGVAAILTDPQLRSLLRAFEQQTGADILAMPKVTTLNNRQANVEVVGNGDPGAGDAKPGPSLDVMPVVSADGLTISLLTTARLAELTSSPDDTGAERKQVLQTAVSGNAVLKDGQTAVLSQTVGHSDAGGTTSVEDTLVVLVTPTLIDAAGNRIHPAEEIAAKDISTGAAQSVEALPPPPVEIAP